MMLNIMIVYESMFGVTRNVAEAVERGAKSVVGNHVTVTLRRVSEVQPE
jgi:flavodoxin